MRSRAPSGLGARQAQACGSRLLRWQRGSRGPSAQALALQASLEGGGVQAVQRAQPHRDASEPVHLALQQAGSGGRIPCAPRAARGPAGPAREPGTADPGQNRAQVAPTPQRRHPGAGPRCPLARPPNRPASALREGGATVNPRTVPHNLTRVELGLPFAALHPGDLEALSTSSSQECAWIQKTGEKLSPHDLSRLPP